MRDSKLARKAIHFLVLLVILQSVMVGFSSDSASGQEPVVADVGGGRRTATWHLDDPGFYSTQNVDIQGGAAGLSLDNYSWTESQQSDFIDGIWDSNVTITADGNVTLSSDDSNLVANGDFSSDTAWAFQNGTGGEVIAEWDGQLESAHLHHSGAQGPYALVEDFEFAGNMSNWTDLGVGTTLNFNSSGHASSGCMDVRWTPDLPIDDGGARKFPLSVTDWSSFNTLSMWINTLYTGTEGNLTVRINLIDTLMVSWQSQKINVNKIPGWRMYTLGIQGFSGDISQMDKLEIYFNGIDGDSVTEYAVTIDDIQLYYLKRFNETAYINQTFQKSNLTANVPGSVMLNFDVSVDQNLNTKDSYLNLSVSNTSSAIRWEKMSIIPPYSCHVSVDLSELMMEIGDYNISIELWLSVSTRLQTGYSARFDNITILAPSRYNGTYLSESHDTLSQSLWEDIYVTMDLPPETSISIFTRTGNSTNTADGSWSIWEALSGSAIASPPNRYIQYRLDLETSNASKGPTLVDISVDYHQYATTGILETDNFTVSDLHQWESFKVIEETSPETNIAYSYSPDFGGSWFPISNGSSLTSEPSNTLRFKAELETLNTTFTPHLFEMNLTYEYVGPLDHIHMSNDTVSTSAGTIVHLSAWGHDVLHRNVTFTRKWETTDPVGNVTPSGDYTAGMVGSWRVYCSNTNDSVSNYTIVDVSAGSLVRISVEPWDPGTLTTDDQLQFNSTGYDIMDNVVPVSPNWTVFGGIGDIEPGPSPVSPFDATTVGTGWVTADAGSGVVNQTNLFSVVAGELASIVVTPSPANLLPGESVVFHAQGKDDDGNNVSLTSTTWDTNAGTITSSNFTNADFTAQSTDLLGGYIRATQDVISGQATINVDDNDEPPTIQGIIPNQSTYEDYGSWTLDLSSYASDQEDGLANLKWRITGDDSTLYTVVGEDIPGNHILTFSTRKNAFGSDDVNIWLIDSKDQTASQQMWVNITPINDEPIINVSEKEYVRFDVPHEVDYAPYIEDVDNVDAELTLTTNDIDHTTVNGLKVTYDYPESMVGKPVFVILTVSDGQAYSQDVVEIVVSGNYPPRSITQIADITMNEDERRDNAFNLNNYFEDPDDTQLTFGSLSEKVGIEIDGSGMVSLAPKENWFGDELVIFTATDSSGAVAQDPVLVQVLPVNDPPEISGLPDITIHYGVVFNFDVTPYISDIDNLTSELEIDTSEPLLYALVLGQIISYNYPTTTVIDVVVTVSDGQYEDSDTMRVTVTDNHPPVSKGLPNVFFKEDESLPAAFDLDDYFSDLEGDTLVYSVNQTQSYVYATVSADNVVSFSSFRNWSGQQVLTFRAEDEEGAFAEDTIVVTVIPVNDAPVIFPIPRQEGEKNKAWLLDLSPYIYDSDNPKEDLRLNATFEYVTVAGHYLIFNCEDSFDLRETSVSVSDGLLEGSQIIEISVTSYVDPEISMFVWPTTVGLVILALVGLVYWRSSRKYLMEDLFLVSTDGKAMVHKTIRTRPDRDEDMLSGMMTAIRAFAEDTFREEGGTLKSFESEDKKVVLEAAESFYVAAIFAGKEPKSAGKSLQAFVKDVELMYGPTIRSWSGIMDDLGDLPEMVGFFISKKRYSSGDWTTDQDELGTDEED